MFDFDTEVGGGDSLPGPWISWKSEGTKDRQIDPQSFMIRGKDDNGEKWVKTFTGFQTGVVLDIHSTRQGFEKDISRTAAPDRVWGVTKRPDESKTPLGRYAWAPVFAIRIAVSKTDAATWTDSSWGGFEGFRLLAQDHLKPTWQAHPGLLPLVKLTEVRTKKFKNGDSAFPVLTIVKWVAPPPCLAAPSAMDAFDAEPEQPAPAPTPAPQPAAQPADFGDFG